MITSICLLAGFSTRMGQPKQHIILGQKSFLEMIIEKLTANKKYITQMLFVGQADDKKSKRLIENCGGQWIVNPTLERGPLSSIKLALNFKYAANATMLWPVDHPMISQHTILQLCQAFAENPGQIIVPSINLRRGHPSIFPADLTGLFFEIPENEGARKILQLLPERIDHIASNDIWIRKNINTPELLEEARKLANKSK
jgi:molybdenum cofactor cytidylyltransferase